MPTNRQWEILRSIDRRDLAAESRPVFTIDGEDFTDRAKECSYSGDDKVAVVLEAEVSTRLSAEWEQKECRVDFEVSGETFRGFEGRVISLSRKGQSTKIIAATSGYEAGRTPVGESQADDREYSGTRPDTALYDALAPLGYRGFELGPFDGPKLNRLDTDVVSWVEYRSKILEMVETDCKIKAADHPSNIASAYRLTSVKRDTAPLWDFEDGRDTDGVEDETADEERYSRILAYRQDANGINQKVAEAAIDNRGFRVPFKSALPVPMSEDSTDSGYQVAFNEAIRRGTNDAGITVPTVYPPFFMARGNPASAVTKEYLSDSVLETSYTFRITSFTVDALGRKGSVSGEGVRAGTDTVPIKRARFASRVAGGFRRSLWGLDVDAAPYFDTSLPWVVFTEGDIIEFDTDIAAEYGVTITEEPETLQFSDEVAV